MLSIQKFDKITYKKSSDVIIADVLSRASVEDDKFQFHFSDVHLLEFLAVSGQTREKIVSATKKDNNLQRLIKLIKQGFLIRYKAWWGTCYLVDMFSPPKFNVEVSVYVFA